MKKEILILIKNVIKTYEIYSYFFDESINKYRVVYKNNVKEYYIDRKTFDYVQVELKKRLEINKNEHGNRYTVKYSGINIFSGKVVCGDCGSFLGRKVWHCTDKYRKIIYRCNNKYKDKKCESKAVTEDEIKDIFVKEFNKLNRAEAIRNAESLMEKLCDVRKLEKQKIELNKEKDLLIEKNNNLIMQNSTKAMDQELYKKKENAIMVPYNKVEG